MEDSDKTTALKKAYAEIILNTAKEAAARVMVSERKAVRFQQDLCSTKEEALRLLVRLKQMIDAKTIEAEITSSNQQRRIDELEAQLQEAEDIITDLRSELNWVREKLEKARINKSRQSIDATNTKAETISGKNADIEVVGGLHPNQGIADTSISETEKPPLLNQNSPHSKCGNKVKQFDGLSISNSDGCDACESELDVTTRNKELELYRNGCTQRIRALERKGLQGKHSAHVEDQGTTAKGDNENLSSVKVNETETAMQGNRCIVLALRAMSAEVMKKAPNLLGTKKTSKARKIQKRRRKRRWGKPKASSLRSHGSLHIKPCQSLSALSCSKTSEDNADGENASNSNLGEGSEKLHALKVCKGNEDHLQRERTQCISKGKQNKNMKSLDSIPIDHLVNAGQESNLLPANAKGDKDKAQILENEEKVEPVADEDLESGNKGVLVNCENAVVAYTKLGSEMVDVHPETSDRKVTAVSDEINESPRKFDGNRVVKYTFQRKRKKGYLSDNDGNISPAKRKMEEKENNAQQAKESNLDNESPRGSRRLVQVARRLISLSGKR